MLADAMPSVWLSIASRWIHLVSIIVAIGGTAFIGIVFLPAVQRVVSGETLANLRESVRSRWMMVVHVCLVLILISGGYNFYVNGILAKPGGKYHMIFGIKLLLVFVLFFLAIALTGRSEALAAIRAKSNRWIKVVLLLAAIIVALSVMLGYTARLFPPEAAA